MRRGPPPPQPSLPPQQPAHPPPSTTHTPLPTTLFLLHLLLLHLQRLDPLLPPPLPPPPYRYDECLKKVAEVIDAELAECAEMLVVPAAPDEQMQARPAISPDLA